MVYASTHYLVRFGGHFGTALVERDYWSVGFRFGHVSADVAALADSKVTTMLDSMMTAAKLFHGGAGTYCGTSCFLDYATAGRIGPDGKYNPTTLETVRVDNVVPFPGNQTPRLPWNTASVLSLRTTRPRGYASNGRIYWPALALTPENDTGTVASDAVDTRMTAAKIMLDAFNVAANLAETGMALHVFSKVGLGQTAKVTAVRADARLDSIERRENNTPPVYVSKTLTP